MLLHVQGEKGISMSYEDYAKALEGEPIFHVDWKCPKCGAPIDYAAEYAEGPCEVYMPSGSLILSDVLECTECGLDIVARQVFLPQKLDIEVREAE